MVLGHNIGLVGRSQPIFYKEIKMREDIKQYLDYLEFGEDADIYQKIEAIRKYIENLNLKIERLEIRAEMLELINFQLIRKENKENEK